MLNSQVILSPSARECTPARAPLSRVEASRFFCMPTSKLSCLCSAHKTCVGPETWFTRDPHPQLAISMSHYFKALPSSLRLSFITDRLASRLLPSPCPPLSALLHHHAFSALHGFPSSYPLIHAFYNSTPIP